MGVQEVERRSWSGTWTRLVLWHREKQAVRPCGGGARSPAIAAGGAVSTASPSVSCRAVGGLGSMALCGPEVEKQVPAEPRPGRKLQSWWSLVFCLCFYGFMSQMRPGESFITPYLLGPDKNFTQQQVTNEITPVLSYSYLAVLVPVFLLTDYLRYKPVLLLQGLSYVSVWLLLLFGSSVLHMQFMEVFFSVTMAARIAYSSYIFSLVPPACYQRMAGYSRASVLLGVFTSSVLGQLLVTVGRIPFSTLNYISLAFLAFSLVLTLFLKRPKRSLFFNRAAPACAGASPSELDRMNLGQAQPTGGKPGRLPASWRDSALAHMLRELGHTARLPQLRLWSLWWVFNSAGYYLIVYYVHILWNVVNPTADTTRVYNGGADAASTLLGAITSFAAGFVKIRWALWAKLIIAVVTGLQAGLVFLMYTTSNIWLCYSAFVLFRASYQFLVPIATAPRPCLRSQHVPRHCSEDHHHPRCLRQAGPGPPSPLSVPHLLCVLPGAVCRLCPCGLAVGPAPLPTGPPPAPAAGPGADEPGAGAGHAGRARPRGRRVGRGGAARGQDLTLPGLLSWPVGGQIPDTRGSRAWALTSELTRRQQLPVFWVSADGFPASSTLSDCGAGD
ncbi:reduced folate transporter isoform X2 [Eubalaena glacialis]|uniref:reduced folate transporter isoform X2 n=1 Tax=Eubalaena glacialis TaxID=27606 RepID=UPI002A5A4D71|nr:reduced folate transporter isoform X2 [Eubalaena glacialis]